MAAKKTWLLLNALADSGEQGGWFREMVERGGANQEEIPEARRRMEEMGIIESAREAVIFHSEEAMNRIMTLPEGVGQQSLAALTRKMQQRLH